MKKLIFTVLPVLLFSFSADKSTLTDDERKTAINHLTETREHMKKVLNGLTVAQLNFQAAEATWSIAQCAEHLAISETAFGELIQKTVAEGNDPALKEAVRLTDDQLLGIIANRSKKVTTSGQFEPSDRFASHAEAVSAFMEKREAHINYVRTTADDLRNRFSNDLPFGTVDAYQLILFAAGHTERHVLQMEEVMQHKYFPSE
ncbi:MAG: DinB family protein [Bacteroidota bacterium]